MKILLTGSSGFIGSHIKSFLIKNNYQLISFSGDITKVTDWNKNLKNGVDTIIHVAGIRTETETDFKVNQGGVEALYQALSQISYLPKTLVLISSQAVYIGSKPPFKEDSKLKPQTLYGISKLKAENLITQIGKEYHIRTVIFRPSPVLGKGVREKSRMSGPLYSFMQKAIQNTLIDIFQDGNQTRDYISVWDVCKAILLALENEKMMGTFNIGGGKRIKVIELAKWIIAAAKSNSKILIKGGQVSVEDPRDLFSDTEKIQQFGWRPEKSLKRTINSLFD